jgi:diphosphomevalonate decarboxylase
MNSSGKTGWESPSNIALVKYWGKDPGQIPMNPSLSFVLKESVVRMVLEYTFSSSDAVALKAFTLNGNPNLAFMKRISEFLNTLDPFFPFLRGMDISISSESTFPHSAGIASSAAAFSALALNLCSMEQEVTHSIDIDCLGISNVSERLSAFKSDSILDGHFPGDFEYEKFALKASFIARLGSGSACRSLQHGFVAWGNTPLMEASDDRYAIKVSRKDVSPVFNSLQDAVLIINDGIKEVSSSAGHALMQHHAYRQSRVAQANENMNQLLKALKTGDEILFFDVIENEALSLHSLMMSSSPGYILMKPASINALERIMNFRRESGLRMGFTMDAGPNIHLIYFYRDADKIKNFINEELVSLCSTRRWIDDGMGSGPVKIL